jgi:hypothetical protein
MQHLIVRHAPEAQDIAIDWARSTPDGDLLDPDIFAHDSTFLLEARSSKPRTTLGLDGRRLAYLPVQQPLMLENLIFAPGLDDRLRSLAITRLAEFAVSEAYRRDAGELYFLCRHPETCAFAESHLFERIDGEESRLKLKVYRLNLRETFGC